MDEDGIFDKSQHLSLGINLRKIEEDMLTLTKIFYKNHN